MSGVLRSVGRAVGTIASIAAIIPGPHQPIAAAVAATSAIAVQATAKGPTARGSISERIIGANQPQPYIMGRTYSGGIQVHDVGYGGEVNGVQNPYRFIATVHSCCGPVEALESIEFDFDSITFDGNGEATGYYANYAFRDFQLGARPETNELQPEWSGAPNWGSAYKLSSYAAMGISLLWSKKGKRFAGGQIPSIGAIWQGVKVYDPRLDSTFPGGSGAHRIDDESTWTYSANPALHAGTYAYGRYVEGNKVFGVDLGETPIDFSQIVAWANVCEANGWTIGGTIYEPGDKWNNLKRICQAGGGQPVLTGGRLQFDWLASRVSLHNVVRDDLAGGPVRGRKGRGWKERHNTIVSRYRSEASRWEYVQSDAVSVASFVTADGEEKVDEIQYDLVQDKDQAAELALYEVYQRREAGPFVVPCKPHMRAYQPGDCLTLKAEIGVTDGDQKVIIRRRSIDPMTGVVTFVCEAETDSKHPAALGTTGTAPSVAPFISSQDMDAIIARNSGQVPTAISGSYTSGMTISQSHNGDGTVDVTISNHTRVYTNGTESSVDGDTLTLDETNTYMIYYDDGTLEGGAVTYETVDITGGGSAADGYLSQAHPDRHRIATIVTVDSLGDGGSSGGSSPPGAVGTPTDPDADIP